MLHKNFIEVHSLQSMAVAILFSSILCRKSEHGVGNVHWRIGNQSTAILIGCWESLEHIGKSLIADWLRELKRE